MAEANWYPIFETKDTMMTLPSKQNNTIVNCILFFLSFIIPFFLSLIFLLNFFFINGAYWLDAGWYTHLMGNFYFINPKSLQLSIGKYMFSTHVYAAADLFSILLYPFHVYTPYLFSIFVSIAFGLLSVFVYMSAVDNKLYTEMMFGLFLSIVIFFSYLISSIISYPHFEIWIPVGLLWFFNFYINNKYNKAFITLLLLCLNREEAGFDVFGVFIILFLIKNLFYRKELININLGNKGLFFCFLAFFSSVAILFIQHVMFHGAYLFRQEYIGSPAFGNINYATIYSRIIYLIKNRVDLYGPFLLIIILSIYTKNLFFVAGYISIIPWVLINIFSARNTLAHFTSYYAYPFLYAALWPTLMRNSMPMKFRMPFIYVQCIILFPTFIYGMTYSWVWKNYIPKFSIAEIRNMQRFSYNIDQNKCKIGSIAIDGSIYSLLGNNYYIKNGYNLFTKNNMQMNFKNVIMIENDIYKHDDMMAIKKYRLINEFNVIGTPIRIYSKNDAIEGRCGDSKIKMIQNQKY